MPRVKKSTVSKSTKKVSALSGPQTESYRHSSAESLMRPEVGTQAQFKKKKPPVTYRYDSSLSPSMEWDAQNPARELGEWLIAMIEKALKLPLPNMISEPQGGASFTYKLPPEHWLPVFDRPQVFKSSDGRISATVHGLQDALDQLKRLGQPFLNWTGKAERLSFNVPTLPLFVHERLSTKAIIETLVAHKKDKQVDMFSLFGDPQHTISDQILKAYEYKDKWVNRMMLGDSLVVMNSLLHYESLGGQVQMIYMDPPYGVKFGSNFQPFVRKRDVKHNEDDDMTREPEMVKAYRDTWELGLHSYLTYMRDRLLIARELLNDSGSIFVQISDENLHHVREVMDEVFGAENFCAVISFMKTGSLASEGLASVCDYLLFYAKDRSSQLFRPLLVSKDELGIAESYSWLEMDDGTRRAMTADEKRDTSLVPRGAKFYQPTSLISSGATEGGTFDYEFKGRKFRPPANSHWKTTKDGLGRLVASNRVVATTNSLRYARYLDDFPVAPLSNVWTGLGLGSFTEEQQYVVQTAPRVILRCLLMTTNPGDLVLDPTCGSGTTAYVAEQWGRRWVTVDTSRVPLALARQRLLTATFHYYELKNPEQGPAGGFIYKRKQNQKGEEVGGIVPHITLKSIANNDPPQEEVLVDRPETDNKITRITGPFCFEATIPTPVDWEGDGVEDSGAPEAATYGSFVDRMLEVLRRSPVLHLGGGKTVEFRGVRKPAKTLSLSAEAAVDATAYGMKPTLTEAVDEAMEKNGRALPLSQKAVAILFGPENGAISEKLVYEAAREAHAKSYAHLFVIGFAIQPGARNFIDNSEAAVGVPATYVQATPDLMMGDLLKNMRSSQIFSVCGMPEIAIGRIPAAKGEPEKYSVELIGLDVFDPVTMEVEHHKGDDVPAWFLDTDYNGMCFHVCQAFFPRTSAWDSLKRALRATHEESVWDHLAGAVSAPFEGNGNRQIAVKVIDDRGNELLVVKSLNEVKG